MVSLIPKKLRKELGNLVSWMEDYGSYLDSASRMAKGGKLAPAPVWGRSRKAGGAAPEFNFTKLANELAPKIPYIKRQLNAMGPVGKYYSKFYDFGDIRGLAALSETGRGSGGREGAYEQVLKKYGVRKT